MKRRILLFDIDGTIAESSKLIELKINFILKKIL